MEFKPNRTANNTRATIITGAPTASAFSLVSTPDRHLVFFGTETTIGTKSTQDPMFIRFSSQEDINTYTPSVQLTLQVHKDLQMDLKLLEQSEVVMQFTFGLILHYLLCDLLVHHLHSHSNKLVQTVD